MPQIRLNLEETADRNLRIYMAKKDIKSKEDAINAILESLKA